MIPPTLSICIPAYNRAAFIGEALESIARQTSDVEVVVSDNASTDDTVAVVESFRDRFASLIVHRSPENIGPDRNYLKVVELATTDYCWLLGSDDVCLPDSIATIRSALAATPGLSGISCNRHGLSFDLTRTLEEPAPGIEPWFENRHFESASECFRAVGDYFGYLSAQVVHRRRWLDACRDNELGDYLNAYVHVYVIGRMLQSHPSWLGLADPVVGWRSGNDSFLASGFFRRLEIDVVGYHQVAAGLFGENSAEVRAIDRRVCAVPCQAALRFAAFHPVDPGYHRAARRMLLRYYWRFPAFYARLLPWLIAPRPVLRVADFVYQRTVKPLLQKAPAQ